MKSASGKTAVLRADATPTLGGGHIMRCLTLADRLSESGWQCTLATRRDSLTVYPDLAKRLPVLLVAEEDDPDELRKARPDGCDLLVVDHYRLDAAFERRCRGWARHIFVIDDLADRPHDADWLLDQTPGRRAEDYINLLAPTCCRLIGPDYALIKPEFSRLRASTPIRRNGLRSVLISFGMTDPDNIAKDAIAAVARAHPAAVVNVVTGAAHDQREMMATATPPLRDFHLHQGTDRMAELMAAADLAIGAGGTTALERCCLGLPSLIVQLADNQQGVATTLAAAGAAIDLGAAATFAKGRLVESMSGVIADLANAPDKLAEISLHASKICDGRGLWRVLLALLTPRPVGGLQVTLRLATESDAETLFRWQTTPGTRRFAHNPDSPSWDEHRNWLAQVLPDPDRLLMIVEAGATAVGMVRVDHIVDRPELSIVIASERQGAGFGKAALELAAEILPKKAYYASIHPDNVASRRLFQRCGYRPMETGGYQLAARAQ